MTALVETSEPPDCCDLDGKRIGLVLAGGGGKGAYQAGCLQGLYDLGIDRFHVICGTSVGSLNGAAAAAGKIPELQNLWREITTASVLHISWRMPIYLIGELASWFLLLQPTIFGIALDIALAALLGFVYSRGHEGYGFWKILIGSVLPVLFLWQIKVLWLLGGFGRLLRRRVETSFSVATNSALSHTIEDFFFPNDQGAMHLHCPTFATVTRDGFWFDPDFPTFLPRVGLGGGDTDFHFDVESPLPAHGWLPEYVDITSFAKADLIEALLQSACLPYAFRRMRFGDRLALDGGVVDNTPLNKCLEFDCDIIIVLHLSADPDGPQQMLDQVPRLRRALYCEAADQAALHRRYLEWLRTPASVSAGAPLNAGDPELEWRYFHTWDLPAARAQVLVPIEPLSSLPPMIHIVPRRPLGGTLTGTLNFRKSKARLMLAQGHEDMIETLRAAGYLNLLRESRSPGTGSGESDSHPTLG